MRLTHSAEEAGEVRREEVAQLPKRELANMTIRTIA